MQNSLVSSSARSLTYIAVMTALLCVTAQISLPLPFTPVPVNLAMLAVFLCGSLLGLKGTAAVAVYLLAGALGLPVFAGLTGGLGHLFGPTGGYLWGYLPAAAATAALPKLWGESSIKYAAAFAAGLLLCYASGTGYFSLYTGQSFFHSLSLCVLPFLAGDILKIALAVFLTVRIKKTIPAI